jgi:hypothetical protein
VPFFGFIHDHLSGRAFNDFCADLQSFVIDSVEIRHGSFDYVFRSTSQGFFPLADHTPTLRSFIKSPNIGDTPTYSLHGMCRFRRCSVLADYENRGLGELRTFTQRLCFLTAIKRTLLFPKKHVE